MNPLIREGPLHKRGGLRHNWLPRKFILKDGHLKYFDGDKEKGSIPTSSIQSVVPTAPDSGNKADKGFPHRFAIHTNMLRTYHLAAETAQDAEAWIAAVGSWIGVDTEAVRAAQEAYRARLAQIQEDALEVKSMLEGESYYKPDVQGRDGAEDFLADKKGKYIIRPGRGETGLALSHHDKKHGVGHIVLWFHKEDGKIVFTETADATDSYESVPALLKGLGFPKACSCGWDVKTHGAADDLVARRSRAASSARDATPVAAAAVAAVNGKKKGRKSKKVDEPIPEDASESAEAAEEKPKKKKGGAKKKGKKAARASDTHGDDEEADEASGEAGDAPEEEAAAPAVGKKKSKKRSSKK